MFVRMTNYSTQVAAALTSGIILSAVMSEVAQMYPKLGWVIGIAWTIIGSAVAIYEFNRWLASSSVDRVVPFIIGAVNAIFGLAIAFASTDGLIYLFIAAAVVDAFAALAHTLAAALARVARSILRT